jgi:outer membrane receptor protein involved in Fe transport
MKKSALLIFLVVGWISLLAQDKKLSITLEKQPITVLLKQIEEQCGYNFIYSDDVISDTIIVSFVAKRSPVSQVLEKVLSEKQLFFHLVSDKLIVIGSKKRLEINTGKIILDGVIANSLRKGIPFASIGLFEGDQSLGGSISNENGVYQLAFNFLPQRTYLLKISSIGYKPLMLSFVYPDTAMCNNIVLTEERNTLKTVTVTGERPLIERKTDRYVVNVEGSALGIGNNGLEVLQKSPGIWVDNNGGIKIRGNQSVMVMINDVVQRMSGSDLADYLRTLRSEDISKIEIISSPPSEFEAEGSGGIVHIILKKTRKDGLIVSTETYYRQNRNRPAYGLALSINYKVKNFYLFGSISGGAEESEYVATNSISYPNQELYASNTDRYNNNKRGRYQFSAAYDLGKNQSIGLQSIQTINKMNQYFDTYINFLGSIPLTGQARSEWFRKPSLNGTTINYTWKIDSLGSALKIIGDYIYSKRTELNNFSSIYTVPTKNSNYRNNTPNITKLYSLQTDYTKIFKRTLSFKTGLKFAATTRDNEVLNENFVGGVWVINPNLSNQFIYKENLSMGYGSLEKSWKKTSIKGGIRAEYTQMEGNSLTSNQRFSRNYLGLFPSIFINQKLNEEKGDVVYLSYSRRLQRPAFADLNPYRLQFDDYLSKLGNPDLTPEYTHKFELGGFFWKGFSADIYYAHTIDKVAEFANPGLNNIIEYQSRNFNNSNEYGFSIFAPVKIYKWWTMNSSFAGYNLSYRIDDFKIKQTTFYFRNQHNVALKNLFDIDFSFDYRSPYVNANKHVSYNFTTDLGIMKRLWNKNLQIRTYFSDIFNTARERDYTDYQGTRIDFYQKRPTRNVSIALNYTFSSGKKFNNKKIEQSNEEEKRRIGN